MHGPPFYAFVFMAGATVWVLSIASSRLKPFVAPPLVALAVGVAYRLLFGPVAPHDELMAHMETFAWFAVAFGVVSIALRLRGRDVRSLLPQGVLIVLVAMLGMWAVSTAVILWLFGLPLTTAAVIGAIVTPTDPVIASSIVTGPFAEKHIPNRIRHMLSLESGANDGLAFPFVFLPVLLIQHGPAGWREWALHVGVWQIGAAALIAVAIGYGAGWALRSADQAGLIGRRSLMLASLTLTVSLMGLMKWLDTDSIWAAFLAGLVITAILGREVREASQQFEEGGNQLASAPGLILFAAALPLERWGAMWEAGLAALVLLLLLRRLPVVALLYGLLRPRRDRDPPSDERQARDGIDGRPFRFPRDLWFYGWFGPIGLSAVFYAGTVHNELGDPRIWTIASFLILGSILVHGLTAAPFTRLYGHLAGRSGEPRSARPARVP